MPLPTKQLALNGTADCSLCGALNEAWPFRAALVSAPVAHPEEALVGEAACYDHPEARAVTACQLCGRFLCPLCSVEIGAEVLCPSCVASGKVAAARLNPSLTLFDSIALTLPLASLIIYPFLVVAAPASLVLSALRWKKPLSPVRRNRWRFVVAIVVSLIEIGLMAWGIVYLIAAATRGGSNQ
jgi:uncharacterized membrane protein YidH (DUF202 family)